MRRLREVDRPKQVAMPWLTLQPAVSEGGQVGSLDWKSRPTRDCENCHLAGLPYFDRLLASSARFAIAEETPLVLP